MKWIKKHMASIVLFLILLLGLSLLLYPSVSDYWNSFHQSKAIAGYLEVAEDIDKEKYQKLIEEAQVYNARLSERTNRWILTDEEREEYNSLLNVDGNGIMGYIEIPCISVSLPIYHGVSDKVLQIAIGHIEGSSLPVGGEGTHSVISGHRGLPSAKLFTNLDELVEGDIFKLCILKDTITYEVDQIRIVEPEDLSALEIEPGKDYCTLITCTPYGVNSHRLLVRGHRIENLKEVVQVNADAFQIDPVIVAPLFFVPMFVVLFIWIMIFYRKKR